MGVTLLRITIVMLVLSWSTVVARLSVRRWLKPEAMGMDDHMMCVGLVSEHLHCTLFRFYYSPEKLEGFRALLLQVKNWLVDDLWANVLRH